MRGLDYWIGTILSNPTEYAVLLGTFLVFGIVSTWYNDKRDSLTLLVGGLLLALALGVVGPRYAMEWHYWVGGGFIAAVVILVIDEAR